MRGTARRRYISTEISVDKRINKFINKYGAGAGLLYTWMIPHAEDDRSITDDPDEIKMTVVPGISSISIDDISQYLSGMLEFGLVETDGEKLYFPGESFYKYQSYIPEAKRNHNKMPKITEEHRQTPQNAVSPSPSPSPSKTYDDFFNSVWLLYPRKEGKGQVSKTQKEKLYKIGYEQICRCVERYKKAKVGKDKEFLQHGSTFFNSGYVDYLDENYVDEKPKGSRDLTGYKPED